MKASRTTATLLFFFLCVTHSACADTAANFVCDDGKEFTVIFESAGTALIMIDGGGLRLEERRTASGFWYASPYGELRGKNDWVRFKAPGQAPRVCRKADD